MTARRIGKYELREALGKGGMATVFLAWDTDLERKVAVKVLHPILGDRPEGLERFHREAKAAARLRHRNIIEVFDFFGGTDENPPFLVYEFVDGPDLAEFMSHNPPPFPETAALIGRCLALALGTAHERGIVHRDIKPENVLVEASGRLVLTDFGIARLAGDETVTATGAVLGSPAYMSPEQARGERTDHRSDIFSLGVLLYRLVVGKPAFAGGSPVAVLSAVLQGAFEPPGRARPDLGREMSRILERAMAHDPNDRYQSAREFADDLEQLARGGGIQDFDEHLAEYLRHPARHEQKVEPVIISSLLARAEDNLHERPAVALGLVDRILAFDPEHKGAAALLNRLRGAKRRRLLLGVLAGVLTGVVAVVAMSWALAHMEGERDGGAAGRTVATTQPVGRMDASVGRDSDLAESRSQPSVDSGLPLRTPGGELPLVSNDALRRSAARTRSTRPSRGSRRLHSTGARVAGGDRILPEARPDGTKPGGGPGLEDGPKSPPTTRARPSVPVSAQPPKKGRLVVLVKPWCTVYVDGKKVGRSPFRRPIEVSAGRHRVLCRQRPGDKGFSKTIEVRPGGEVTVHGSLLAPCLVTIPTGRGTWLIDGAMHRPGTLRLPAGRHRVQVLLPGGAGKTNWVLFPPGGRCRLGVRGKLGCF